MLALWAVNGLSIVFWAPANRWGRKHHTTLTLLLPILAILTFVLVDLYLGLFDSDLDVSDLVNVVVFW